MTTTVDTAARPIELPTELPTGLRNYQQTAVNLTVAELVRAGRAYLSLPTGSGKSRILGELARLDLADYLDPEPGTILVVSPRRQITAQLAHALAAGTGHRATTLPTATPGEDSAAGPIVVGGADNIRRWALRNAARPRLILVDEAHHATAEGCRRLLGTFPDAHRVGVTATPYRHDGDQLDDVLGRCVMVRDPDHQDMAGVLAPVEWSAVRLPVNLGDVPVSATKFGRDYKSEALGAILTTEAAVAATVAGTVVRIEGRSTVVFAATIGHADALATAYADAGFRVGQILGSTPGPVRERLIAALTLGPAHPDGLDILVNVTALTEGFDCPPVNALVMARPTRSELLYTQILGRGLRVHPGKTSCVVLDVTGVGDSATPSATGQVFAPTVLPSKRTTTASDGADREPGDWWALPGRGGPLTRQLVGTNLRSPTWSWAPGPDGVMQVPLVDGQVGVLVPDGDSGLWAPVLLNDGAVERLDGSLPVRHAVDRFVGLASRHLTRADSTWRSHPTSDPQLRKLRRLDWTLVEQAVAESWSKGHTSDVIAALITVRTLSAVAS